jgi:hypothetical protein
MGDRYGASDFDSVLGDDGCRPGSPMAYYTSLVWGRLEPEGLGLQSNVGCRCRVNTRTGRATVADQEASGEVQR